MNLTSNTNTKLKIVLLGAVNVGKSSLSLQYVQGRFFEHQTPSTGASFQIKSMRIANETVDVQIWDSAGQERFQQFSQLYYKDANGVCVVFDVTTETSIERAKQLIQQIIGANPECGFAVIGNKMDLLVGEDQKNDFETLRSEFKSLTNNNIFTFGLASAKTGSNVCSVMDDFCEKLYHKLQNNVQTSVLSKVGGALTSCKACKQDKDGEKPAAEFRAGAYV